MPDHHHPKSRRPEPPTLKQQRYLRQLAQRTGQTFTPPTTKAEASREIARLKQAKPLTRVERRLDSWGAPAPSAAVVHEDEITGYGASARWA